MSTRFRLGISVLIAMLAAPLTAHAQGAVTVIGGGMAKECYEAVEFSRVQAAKALEVCDQALDLERLSPRDKAATYTNRGILYMRAGNNTRALWDYQRSLEVMPRLQEAKVNLGAALYNLKRYPEALVALNEGVGTDSIDAKAIGYYNRGLTHEKLGDIQSAYEDFRRALQTNPELKQAADQMARFTVVPADS
ncbi:MAG: tetratricopeptide repeat protein [Hyphomonadaceae bacterium]